MYGYLTKHGSQVPSITVVVACFRLARLPSPPLSGPGQVMKNVAADELLEATDAYMTDAKVAPRACFGHTTLEQTSGASWSNRI